MKRTRAILTLLLAVCMMLGMLPSAAMATESPYAEKVVFTMSAIDAERVGLNDAGEPSPLYTWLCEKFNVDFEFLPLTWSNYVDQTRLWLNSNSAPDLIFLDVAAVRYGEYLEWVDAGLFRPYPDLVNYPNLKARLDGMTTGQKFVVDGKLYAWPGYVDSIKYNFVSTPGFIYRKDWARQVGLAKEDDIYSWQEWWDLTRAVKQANPGAGGETIGLIFTNHWDFPLFIVEQFSPSFMRFAKNAEGNYVWATALPESKEGLLFTKQLYDEGLIWVDQPLNPPEAARNNFVSGKLFAYCDNNHTTRGILTNQREYWDSANPGLAFEETVGLAKVKAPSGTFVVRQGGDQWSQTAMNVDIDDKKAERWLDILEYLVSDEGYLTRNFGIKGIDWDMKEDKIEFNWPVNATTGKPENPNGSGFWWFARAAGCNDNSDLYLPTTPEWLRNMMINHLNVLTGPDAAMVPLNVELQYFVDPDFLAATSGLEEATYQKFAELVASPNFSEEWDAWITTKQAEIQPAIDALNNAF